MLEPSKNRATNEKTCWKRRTGLERKLIVLAVIVSAIALVFLILFFTKRSCSRSDEECTEKNCVKASAELLEFVDLKKDPCDDFYHYVCGHYQKDAVKKGAPTPILQVTSEFNNELKSIIVDPVRKKDTKANIAMKQFYHACMNESKIDADKDLTFIETINELGGWPLVNGSDWEGGSFDWVNWYLKSFKLGVPVIGFFSFRSAIASDNSSILRVSSSNLQGVDITKTNFETLMNNIAIYFNASEGYGSENIEVYDFMKRIRKLSEDVVEEDDEDEDISTVEDLYKKCPQFPWLKILNGLSEGIREMKNDTSIVFGMMKEYCNGLDRLIRDTPHRIIANYYVWSIIQFSQQFMSRKIRNAYENLEETTVERFEICYEFTDDRFKYLKETVYIRRKTKPEVKEQLEELIDILKEVFIEHLKVGTWMDEETKERAIEKTKLIEKVIGADDILYDVEKFDKILGVDGLEFGTDNAYQILKKRNIRDNTHLWETVYGERPENWKSFFENVNDVNAAFATSLNVMIIPAPILNSIFFNYKMPAFMNFGSIGRVVGHEVMHGFGEAGREVILENDKTVDWWTNATAEAFNKTKQCAIEAYEKIPFRYKLNGTLTLDENLADLVGIDVAYEAYGKWVKKHGEEKRLPGIPLTPKQIFWIQTGTFLCFRKLDDDDTDMNAEDVHAIPSFRVTAGAMNSIHFAKDFNCPEGSRMNPKEKCRIL